jgi:hypothetical protein
MAKAAKTAMSKTQSIWNIKNDLKKTLMKAANPAAFEATERKAVMGVGAPS